METLILRRLVFAFFFAGYLPLCFLFASSVAGWASVVIRLAGLATIIVFSFFAVYVHSLFPRRHRSPEDFPVLLTGGPYGHIRHPFYSCFIFIGYGAALLAISPIGLALDTLLIIPLFTFLARKEEEELLERWGGQVPQIHGGEKDVHPWPPLTTPSLQSLQELCTDPRICKWIRRPFHPL